MVTTLEKEARRGSGNLGVEVVRDEQRVARASDHGLQRGINGGIICKREDEDWPLSELLPVKRSIQFTEFINCPSKVKTIHNTHFKSLH